MTNVSIDWQHSFPGSKLNLNTANSSIIPIYPQAGGTGPLDCVSIFALTCPDALTVFEVCQGPDPADPFSRARPEGLPSKKFDGKFRFGVPQPAQLKFFGNKAYEGLFQEGVECLAWLGGQKVEIDFTPFAAIAQLLYDGPWVAERLAALKEFINARPESLHPVTRAVIEGGRRFSAVDLFEAYHQLHLYQKQAAPVWAEIDLLVVPTTGTIYTLAEVEAEPFALNTNLGYYTNFVNLLDLCAWAMPNGFQLNGLPMGLTLVAPAFQESYLAGIATAFHQSRNNTQVRMDFMNKLCIEAEPYPFEFNPSSTALLIIDM